jgi:hypothetical protein
MTTRKTYYPLGRLATLFLEMQDELVEIQKELDKTHKALDTTGEAYLGPSLKTLSEAFAQTADRIRV